MNLLPAKLFLVPLRQNARNEINKFDSCKTIHDTDITVKILNENDFFGTAYVYFLTKLLVHLNCLFL